MRFILLLREKGQTSVEYLLVVAVAAGMCVTFFKKFQGYLIDNPNSYMNIHKAYYERMFDPQLKYKRFYLPR